MFRCAADSNPGNSEGRMTFMSSEIGLARLHVPPPNASAAFCGRNDQLIASFKPRAAAARRTLRSSDWTGVAVGLATPSARGNGTDTTLSRPTIRTTSSTMSAGPSTSRRHVGTVTRQSSLTEKPSLSNILRCSSGATSTPPSCWQYWVS